MSVFDDFYEMSPDLDENELLDLGFDPRTERPNVSPMTRREKYEREQYDWESEMARNML